MSKLFDTIIKNLFQERGRGLEEDVVEAFNNLNKDTDIYLEYTNPNKAPVSRAFLLDVTKSLKEGFMYNVEQFRNKEHEDLLKDFESQREFLKENSKSKGFLKKEKNDPFDAFVELKSSDFDFEPFITALKTVQSDKTSDISFPAKLVCAIIEAKTSMELTTYNLNKMYEIEKQLIPYIYAYANKHGNTTHLEIQNEIFSYFGLNNNPSKTRNFKARDYLRGLSINYLIKTHTQNDPIKNTDVEGNSLEYGLKTVYPNGELGKIFIQQDQKENIPNNLNITQLIKQGQIVENSNGKMNFTHRSKYLQQALINIHKKLNSNNPISNNNDFLTTAVAYLILAKELKVEDIGDFIGIALADPITEIAKTLSKNEIEELSNKAYELANSISKEELDKEIEKPKTLVLVIPTAQNENEANEASNQENIENSNGENKNNQKSNEAPNYIVKNLKKFYSCLIPKLISNMTKTLDKYKDLQNILNAKGKLDSKRKTRYEKYLNLYGSVENMEKLISELKSIAYDFIKIEKYMLKSLKSGKEFPEIEEKIKKAMHLADENLKKFEGYYNLVKSYDNTKIIKLANILEIKDKDNKTDADNALIQGVLRYYLPPKTKTKQPKIPQTENPGTENPGTENPGTENPGTENPGTENPKTENHGEKED